MGTTDQKSSDPQVLNKWLILVVLLVMVNAPSGAASDG